MYDYYNQHGTFIIVLDHMFIRYSDNKNEADVQKEVAELNEAD